MLNNVNKIMKALIKIKEENGQNTVSARELHKYLESTERFSNWIDRQFKYGFEEGVDYIGCEEFNTLANQSLMDYALTLDASKEISMLQKNDKGKEARRYFIDYENQHKSKVFHLPNTFSEALRQLADITEQKEQVKLQLSQANDYIQLAKPKVVFAESVTGSRNSILIREFAKDLCDNVFNIGQNRLFKWFRDNRYLMRDNNPYQNYVDMGLFEVVTRSIGSGSETFTSKTTKVSGKGQVYFASKIKNINPYINLKVI
jgi:anti-repressor protein